MAMVDETETTARLTGHMTYTQALCEMYNVWEKLFPLTSFH